MKRHYPEIALHVPTLLLPRDGVSLETWSVIACDQYTSEPEYWEQVREIVGALPSTLHLVFPEVYLNTADRAQVIDDINRCMEEYLATRVLIVQRPGFMLVSRDVGRSAPRKGLVVALDLEEYDYRDGAQKLIRTTEGTDQSRLPPRIQVRQGASVETPHIMVLIDDPQRTVIDPLFERDLELAYDFELMLGGGRLQGWRVDDGALIDTIAEQLAGLSRGEPPMAYAVGDGNHSFATARAVWEDLKREAGDNSIVDHPARYALVELVNLHDEGLAFEPIHRVICDVDPQDLLRAIEADYVGLGFSRQVFAARDEWDAVCREALALPGHHIPYIGGAERGLLSIARPDAKLAVASLQVFLDCYLAAHSLSRLDYIHGETVVEKLAVDPQSIGFLLPPMDKHELFASIVADGATPRKTFSLGEAEEKRYYLECRQLVL